MNPPVDAKLQRGMRPDHLRWAAEKLSARGPWYVASRLSYTLRRALTDRMFALRVNRLTARFADALPGHPGDLRHYLIDGPGRRFHFDGRSLGDLAAGLAAKYSAETIRYADSICEGRFSFRGETLIVGSPPDWGRARPNISLTWDLNRHFYFAQLGFAYWYSREAKYLEAFSALSTSWVRSCGGRLGRLHWDHPFEVAARLNGWIWGLFLFLESDTWDPVEIREYLFTIGLLATYLHAGLETHNPGNHMLLEAKALAMAGEIFRELPGADRWRHRGWRLVQREITRQIGRDGVHLERSTMYHRIVAGELAELVLLCRRNGLHSIGTELHEVVKRMAEFQSATAFEDGSFALLGDAYLKDTYYRFDAPTVARALGHDVSRSIAIREAEEQTLWALGGGTTLPGRATAPRSCAFPEGGYHVSQWPASTGHSAIIWDCGPVGYPENLNHAHLDALSFVWVHAGVPVLIDPGTSERDNKLRRSLRATFSHNTVEVDGKSQSELGPRQSVLRPARATVGLLEDKSGHNVMMGWHDGYLRLRNPVRHVRCIVVMKPRYCLVLDRIEGRGSHRAVQFFHVAPNLSAEIDERSNKVKLEGVGVRACVQLFDASTGAGRGNSHLAVTEETAELEFGRPVPHPVVHHTFEGEVPVVLGALLLAEADPGSQLSVHAGLQRDVRAPTVIQIQGPGFADTISVNWGTRTRSGTSGFGPWKPRVSIRRFATSAADRS